MIQSPPQKNNSEEKQMQQELKIMCIELATRLSIQVNVPYGSVSEHTEEIIKSADKIYNYTQGQNK